MSRVNSCSLAFFVKPKYQIKIFVWRINERLVSILDSKNFQKLKYCKNALYKIFLRKVRENWKRLLKSENNKILFCIHFPISKCKEVLFFIKL